MLGVFRCLGLRSYRFAVGWWSLSSLDCGAVFRVFCSALIVVGIELGWTEIICIFVDVRGGVVPWFCYKNCKAFLFF